ncbi:hypothetical protein pb186bvf_002227 [Paramecium bursaria]
MENQLNKSEFDSLMLTQPQTQYKIKFDDNNKMAKEIERDYNKIHDIIRNLEGRVGEIIKAQEEDFMIAFKEQMHDIQKELKTMKRKIDEEALRQKADEKKRILEEERDYFREEALRLDKLCQEQQRTIEELKFKLKITNEEKNYYEGFVIDSKKENKALKYEILQLYKQKMEEQKITKIQEAQRPLTDGGKVRNEIFTTGKKFDDHQFSQHERLLHSQQQTRNSEAIVTIGRDFRKPESSTNQQTRYSEFPKAYSQKKLDNDTVRLQFEREKKINQQLKIQLSQNNIQRGQLEQILLDCVNQRKKDIKVRQLQQKQMLNGQSVEFQEIDWDVEFSQFTQSDKKELLKQYIKSEQFLDRLYDITFNQDGQKTSLNEKWKRDASEASQKFNQFKKFKFFNSQVGVSSGVSKKDIQSSFNNFTDKTRKLIQKVKE